MSGGALLQQKSTGADGRAWVTHYAYPRAGDTAAVSAALDGVRDVVDSAPSWHYLHFVNAAGFHLRVRVRAVDPAGRNDLAIAVRDVLSPVSAALVRTTYFPETRKYGTGDSLAASEDLFCASSRFAREHLHEGLTARVGVAANLMYATIRAFPTIDATSFCHHYAWYWNGGVPPVRHRGVTIAAGASEGVSRVDELVESSQKLFAKVKMSPYAYVFHHLHLTNNRLGLSRQLEVLVAQIVRHAIDQGVGSHDRPSARSAR